ncbi:MAG: metallophosphoesterase [bacterium]|nr:metallophosphoesterase [bacterium]
MAERDTTILFVGDMHLGRLPARVPVEVMGGRLPPLSDLGPGAAWLRTAGQAVRLGVDAVALAGDVVHGANDLFEGANELAKGLEILAAARIPVVAVAGNHDTRVLPDLARRGGITLLGAGGTWSAFDLAPAGRAPVRLVGWSFPAPHWEASPLQTPPPPAAPGLVTLGLLHGDLDVPGSRYAPVAGAGLMATGYTAWLLGHVHRPDEPPVDGRPFYLGSLTGLDPTETGRHGPVLARIGGDGRLELQRLPLAPLAWLAATLDVGAAEAPARDLPTLVRGAMEDAVLAMPGGPAGALAVGVRLTCAARSPRPGTVRRAAAAGRWSGRLPERRQHDLLPGEARRRRAGAVGPGFAGRDCRPGGPARAAHPGPGRRPGGTGRGRPRCLACGDAARGARATGRHRCATAVRPARHRQRRCDRQSRDPCRRARGAGAPARVEGRRSCA